jgi:hypothetical protein
MSVSSIRAILPVISREFSECRLRPFCLVARAAFYQRSARNSKRITTSIKSPGRNHIRSIKASRLSYFSETQSVCFYSNPYREPACALITPCDSAVAQIFKIRVGMGAQPGQGVLREIAKRPSLDNRTIQCGHDAMLDEPEEVANILREAAEITLTKF